MTLPALPAQGSTSWYGYMQDLDTAVRNGVNATPADGSITAAKIADNAVVNRTIIDGAVTHAKVAAANKDGGAGVPSMRTLGTGAQQAAAGDHNHDGRYVVRVADATSNAAIDTTNVQNAIAAAQTAGGGTVLLGRGDYYITANTLAITGNDITVIGQGNQATILRKNGNGRLLDISGTSTTYPSGMRFRVRLADMQLHGWDQAGDLVRAWYTQFLQMDRVLFLANRGVGLNALQLWDSYFNECRWDYCSAGTTGSEAAVHVKVAEQGVGSGFGFSTDNSNNVNFHNCTWEQNEGYDVWFDGRSSTGTYVARVNECTFSGRTKIESATNVKRRAYVRLENVDDINFDSLQITAKGAATTAVDMIQVIAGEYVHIVHSRPEMIEHTSSGVRTVLSVGANTRFLRADLAVSAATTNKPTVAAVEYVGTGRTDNVVTVGYLRNPGSAVLSTGTGPNNP